MGGVGLGGRYARAHRSLERRPGMRVREEWAGGTSPHFPVGATALTGRTPRFHSNFIFSRNMSFPLFFLVIKCPKKEFEIKTGKGNSTRIGTGKQQLR